jgi:choline dehydrogenase
MLNATFATQALSDFDKLPAQGPYTLSMSNSAIFVPLPNISVTYPDIIAKIQDMASNSSSLSFASSLPPDYTSPLYTGYRSQLLALASLLSNPSAPSLESGFATGTTANAINLHTLSRGTVRLDPSDPLSQPILDYRTATNPIDLDVYKSHILYLRRMISTPTLTSVYGAVEMSPGDAIAGNDTLLTQYVKDKMTFSFMHPCCTAGMIPKEKGGVVGTDLKVHGTRGLRVVDMSILPMLPSSHLSQLAYAVGEKVC